MKVLLTGSNGLLGQKLAHILNDDPDIDLLASARGESRLPGYINYKSLDISDQKQVNQIFEEFVPDAVINTAAMTNVDDCELQPEKCYEVNVTAVEYLVNAANQTGSLLIHLSTDFIFKGDYGPLTEEHEPDPVNYYGECKLKAEKLIQEKSKNWAIARTVLVYGIVSDMSRSNIILWVKKSLEDGKQIKVVNDQYRTPTLAEDLAMGCYLILINKAEGIYNISGKDFLTPYQMAIFTADYFNLDKSLIEKTDSTIFKQPAERPLKTGFIIDKAEKELGYKPHSFTEGIAILDEQVKTIGKT